MKEYTKQSNKQESTNSDLEDQAAIYLEEMNISGDTMIQMNHHLDDIPKDKIGAYYLNDLMAGFVRRNENMLPPDVAEKILKVRDAIVEKDYDEVWHWLYSIASPNYDKPEPWEDLERMAGRL